MLRKLCYMACVCGFSYPAAAGVLAHWTFETADPDQTQVPHALADGVYEPTLLDASGNGNNLSVYNASWAGFKYRADSAPNLGTINGVASTRSIQNTGGYPAAMAMDENGNTANPGSPLHGVLPQFTVEASYKPENSNSWRTIVGRDDQGVNTADGNAASFYLQVTWDNRFRVFYTDVMGVGHEAVTAAGAMTGGFDFGADPTGATGTWYNMAATMDGTWLRLYVNNVEVAATDMTGSSTNTALTVGTNPGGSPGWQSGAWTVGRGLYGGGHGDRAYGLIDDVRISDIGLTPDQLLMAIPEPTALSMAAVAGGLFAGRRRRQA